MQKGNMLKLFSAVGWLVRSNASGYSLKPPTPKAQPQAAKKK